MKADIFFTIVIPTYNRADYIATAIRSALNQTYPHFEIIVVDDGSTDDTERVVHALDDKRIFYYKKQNAERGAARNYGTERSKGDYITFLDSDDIVYPHFLEYALENISRNDSPPFFHMGFEIKDHNNKIVGRKQLVKNEKVFTITKGNYISCIGVFIRNDVAAKFRFNEDVRLSGSEDWELWLRIVANVGVHSDNRAVACFTQHDERSVMNISEEKLLHRKNLSLLYSFQDEAVTTLYSTYKKMMEAHLDLYLALHLALAGRNKRSMVYLAKAFSTYPKCMFEKRFYAVIKRCLINIFHLS